MLPLGGYSSTVQIDGELANLNDDGVSPPFTTSISYTVFVNVGSDGFTAPFEYELSILTSSPFRANYSHLLLMFFRI